MNKRQSKKNFRKYVRVFPIGRRTRAGIWKKKRTRMEEKELLEAGILEKC